MLRILSSANKRRSVFDYTTGIFLNPHPGILNKNDINTNGTLIYKPVIRTTKSSSGGKTNNPWCFE